MARLSWPGRLVMQRDDLSARRLWPVPLLTGLNAEQLCWRRPACCHRLNNWPTNECKDVTDRAGSTTATDLAGFVRFWVENFVTNSDAHFLSQLLDVWSHRIFTHQNTQIHQILSKYGHKTTTSKSRIPVSK